MRSDRTAQHLIECESTLAEYENVLVGWSGHPHLTRGGLQVQQQDLEDVAEGPPREHVDDALGGVCLHARVYTSKVAKMNEQGVCAR